MVKAFEVGKTSTKEGMFDDLFDGWYEPFLSEFLKSI